MVGVIAAMWTAAGLPKTIGCVSLCHIDVINGSIILIVGFGRPDVADGLLQSAVVEPVDPFECGAFDSLKVAPRPAPVDYLSLVEAVNRLGQSLIVAVTNTADRRFDPNFCEALGAPYELVLRTAIAVMG